MLSIGPGPVERDHRRQVVHRRRPELADVAAHARRLELEDAGRLARGQQLEGLARRRAGSCRGRSRRRGSSRTRSTAWRRIVRFERPEEVELEQAQRLDGVHLVLGHERIRVGGLLERHQLGQRLAADHDPGRMRRGVARHALELLGEVEHALDRWVARRTSRAAAARSSSASSSLMPSWFGTALAMRSTSP